MSLTQIKWTPDQMPDLRGRHAVVTGGNSGLGYFTVRELSRRGVTVTMAVRDLARGRAAREQIVSEVGPVEVDVRELDLASLVSIRDFASHLATAPLDLLINNAGVMAPPRAETADGFELQFGVNHLGHYALTGHLFEALRKSDAPRVVTVSSNAHKTGKINFADLHSREKYSAWAAYSQSKFANLLFAFELQRRAEQAGIAGFRSVAAHPGYSATNLSAVPVGRAGAVGRLMRKIEPAIAQSAEMGALPQLYAATAAEVPGGAYVGPDGWGEWRGHPRLVTPVPAARDAEAAAQLWQVSAELTGVRYLD